MAKFVSKENLTYYHSKIKTPLNFAQEEYNKSLNEFNINSLISSTSNACTSTISNGAINTVATGNYAYKLYYMRGLEIGKTYSISFKGIKVGSSESQVFIGNAINVDSTAYARKWLGTSSSTFTITFTATTDILSITTYVAFGDYVNGANLTISEIMLNKGNLPLPYQPYNGKIIHRGDIEPVLLWENASPSSEMGETIATLSKSLVVGKNYAIYYKYSTGAVSKLKLEFKYGGVGYLGWLNIFDSDANGNYLRSRLIQITSETTIKFYVAMTNNYVNNGQLIPTELYELPN